MVAPDVKRTVKATTRITRSAAGTCQALAHGPASSQIATATIVPAATETLVAVPIVFGRSSGRRSTPLPTAESVKYPRIPAAAWAVA